MLSDADRLTMLGPMCIIASLSIGATRTFRIRRVAAPDGIGDGEASASRTSQPEQAGTEPGPRASARFQQPTAPQQPDPSDPRRPASRTACPPPTTVDIELKHNSLVIMWPPMQEEWKHEVCAQLAGTSPLARMLTESNVTSILRWRAAGSSEQNCCVASCQRPGAGERDFQASQGAVGRAGTGVQVRRAVHPQGSLQEGWPGREPTAVLLCMRQHENRWLRVPQVAGVADHLHRGTARS